MPAKTRRKTQQAPRVPAVAQSPTLAMVPSPPFAGAGAGQLDPETGLGWPAPADYPRTGDPSRDALYPQFGQIARSGLLAYGGAFGPTSTASGAGRVFNPDTITLAEYDMMSLDPTIRACLLGYALIMQTADLQVSCPDSAMKSLVEQEFVPKLKRLMRETVMTRLRLGWADAEVVWETRYNVPVEQDTGKSLPPPGSPAQPPLPNPAMMASGLPTTPGVPAPPDSPYRVYPYVTVPLDFVPLPNDSVVLRQTPGGHFAGLVQWAWGEQFIPPAKLFHTANEPVFRNPYGTPATKSCYPYFYWKRFTFEMLMVALERSGSPPILGRYPANARVSRGTDSLGRPVQVDAKDVMTAELAKLRSFAVAAFPSTFDEKGNQQYTVEELSLEPHIDYMVQVIDCCDKAIMMGMFFPDKILQTGDSGAYALAKEHTDTFSLAIQSNLDDYLLGIDEGPLRQFVAFNDPACPPASIKYNAPNAEAMMAVSQLASQAIFGGQALVTQNQDHVLVPDWKRLADELGIPYQIVRKVDGMDALGNPLNPGMDPDQQDSQAAGGGQGGPTSGAQGGQGGGAGANPDVADFGPKGAGGQAQMSAPLAMSEGSATRVPKVTFGTGDPDTDRPILKEVTGHTDVDALHRDVFGAMAPHIDAHYRPNDYGTLGKNVAMSGTIHHPETGEEVGDIERLWYGTPGKRAMTNKYLELHESAQGQGIASRLYDAQEQHARKQGIGRIYTHADIDVGPYAWARQGFDWTPEEAPAVRASYHQSLHSGIDHLREQGNLTDEQAAAAHDRVPGLTHSWDVANFDVGVDMPLKGREGQYGHLGKAVMLHPKGRRDYDAVKVITPHGDSPHEQQAARVRQARLSLGEDPEEEPVG